MVSDPDRRIWDAHAVRAWPTLVLVDVDGTVAGRVSGEGRTTFHDHIEQYVAELVERARAGGRLDIIVRSGFLAPSFLAREGARAPVPGKVLADAASGRLFIADLERPHRSRPRRARARRRRSGAEGSGDGARAGGLPATRAGDGLHGDRLYVADTGNHRVRARSTSAPGACRRCRNRRAGSGPPLPRAGRRWRRRSARRGTTFVAAGPDGRSRPFLWPWPACIRCGSWTWSRALPSVRGHLAASGIADGPRGECWLACAERQGTLAHRRWLFVADSEVSALRCIDLEDDSVSTVGRSWAVRLRRRGRELDEALLQHPLGVAVDGRR